MAKKTGIQRAVDHCVTQQALADLVGVSQPTIWRWLQAGRVPPDKVVLVEKITRVPREELHPELYR